MAKIIIVDDSSFVRAVLSKYLTKNGHEIVAEAGCNDSAVEMYKKHRPDLVTLDVVMPGCGIAAMQEILDFDPEANIIIISGLAQPTHLAKAIKKGAKCFLSKPICDKMLLKVVNDVLASNSNKKKDNNFDYQPNVLIKCPDDIFLLSMFNNSLKEVLIMQNDILVIEKGATPAKDDLIVGLKNDGIVFGYRLKQKTIIYEGNNRYELPLDSDIENLGIIRGVLRVLNSKAAVL